MNQGKLPLSALSASLSRALEIATFLLNTRPREAVAAEPEVHAMPPFRLIEADQLAAQRDARSTLG